MTHFDETAKRRIRFLTRRGLLELDLMLGQFMQQQYAQLTDPELAVFVQILDLPDQQFLAILNGTEASPDDQFNPLLDKIRQAAKRC